MTLTSPVSHPLRRRRTPAPLPAPTPADVSVPAGVSRVLPEIATQTPPYQQGQVHYEIDARPGTVLGGPLCSGRAIPGCQRVSTQVLAEQHLLYLRAAYREGGPVRQELDRLAAVLRYGRSRLGVFGLDATVAGNVARAIRGIADHLPYRELYEA